MQSDRRWSRVAPPLATIAVLGAATVALHVRDPHGAGSWGACPSATLGFWCPGCGGLRAVNDLTDLRIADAASSNVLLVALVPLVLLVLGRWTVSRWRGDVGDVGVMPALAAPAAAVLLVAMLVFTVARNLPGGLWLAP